MPSRNLKTAIRFSVDLNAATVDLLLLTLFLLVLFVSTFLSFLRTEIG